ncbi:hypothetical protein Lal_00024300, partial [Lupinus albus]
WRGVASQVLPCLEEDDRLAIFINTLQNPYFDRMIGNITPDFNALIKVGSRIEHNLKSEKIRGDQFSANEGMIKDEGETNFLVDGRKYKKPKNLSYVEFFDQLQGQGMLTLVEGNVFKPPYPKWYDPAASCAYHYNIAGHSIEKCKDLKYKTQELIDSKLLDFGQAIEKC